MWWYFQVQPRGGSGERGRLAQVFWQSSLRAPTSALVMWNCQPNTSFSFNKISCYYDLFSHRMNGKENPRGYTFRGAGIKWWPYFPVAERFPVAIVRCNFKEMGIANLANLVAGHLYSGKSDTKLGKELWQVSSRPRQDVELWSRSLIEEKNVTYFFAAAYKRI